MVVNLFYITETKIAALVTVFFLKTLTQHFVLLDFKENLIMKRFLKSCYVISKKLTHYFQLLLVRVRIYQIVIPIRMSFLSQELKVLVMATLGMGTNQVGMVLLKVDEE